MVRLHQLAPIPALNLRRGFEIPVGMDDFVRTCLAKDSKDRFADANAAILAFEQVMEGFGSAEAAPLELSAAESGLRPRPGITRGARGVVLPQNHVSGDVLDPVGRGSAAAPASDHEILSASAPIAPADDAPADGTDASLRTRTSAAEDTDPPQVSLPSRPSVRATESGKSLDSAHLRTRALLAALSLSVCVALIIMIIYFWG